MPTGARGGTLPVREAGLILLDLLQQTWREWRDDQASRQGAALAFYGLFAMAPLLLVATAVAGGVLGQEAAERRLAAQLEALTTPEVAQTLQVLVEDAYQSSGWAAGSLGVLTSLYAGARGFFHLQGTLNHMWGVRAVRDAGLLEMVRRKLLAFASALLCGALLLASVLLGMVLQTWAMAWPLHLPDHWLALRLAQEATTFGLALILLMVVFKTLPDARIRWRDVVVGSAVSAGLFLMGKHAIELYLQRVGATSSFGAAGALVAVMLYTYYVAQVLLFGAEFTYVFARWRGTPILPGPGAARVVRTTLRQTGGDPVLDDP